MPPTLRRPLGLEPSPQDQGRDLLGLTQERAILNHLAAKSGQHSLAEDMRSIVRGELRSIVGGGRPPALYDLRTDPGEQRDLAAERPELVAELLRELERLERAAPRYSRAHRVPAPPSEALREHLRGIG